MECPGGLSSAYYVVKCQDGKFQDNGGNQITNGLCGGSELNNVVDKMKKNIIFSRFFFDSLYLVSCFYFYEQAETVAVSFF